MTSTPIFEFGKGDVADRSQPPRGRHAREAVSRKNYRFDPRSLRSEIRLVLQPDPHRNRTKIVAAIVVFFASGLGFGAVVASSPALAALAVAGAVFAGATWLYCADAVANHCVFALVLVVIACTFANFNGAVFLFPGGKYLALFAVAATVLALRPALSSAFVLPSGLALVLCVVGIGGSLWGRLASGIPNTALPVLLPMLLVAVPFTVADSSTPDQFRRWMKYAGAGCGVLIILVGLAYTPGSPVSDLVFNHEKSIVFVGAIGFGLAARSPSLTAFGVLATLFAFIQNPAGTYVLVVISVVVTAVIVLPRYRGPLMPALLSGGFVVGLLLVAFNVDYLLKASSSYFVTVGKVDNSVTRENLYNQVFTEVHNPIVSRLFTNNLSIVAVLSGERRVVPAHSDVLTMYLGGGVVAAALFVGVFGATTYAVSRSRAMVSAPRFHAAVVMVMVANAGLFGGLVNPIVVNPTSSAIIFTFLAGALVVIRRPCSLRVSGGGTTGSRLPRSIGTGRTRRRSTVVTS